MKTINMKQGYMSTEEMGREIAKNIKPIERTINVFGRNMIVTVSGEEQRVKGPELVRISHNKNTVTLGEIFPTLYDIKIERAKEMMFT